MEIFNLTISSNYTIKKHVNNSLKELEDLFSYKLREPSVILINSREDMNQIMKKDTANWFVGCYKYGNIYIFSPDVYESVSPHKLNHFWQTLTHELFHFCYTEITNSHQPMWLNEGLAQYLSGKRANKPNNQNNIYKVLDYFYDFDSDGYEISLYLIDAIIKKYGIKKIVELIKYFDNGIREDAFKDKFKEILHINLDENGIKSIFEK